MSQFPETLQQLQKLPVIDQEALLDDGLMVAETLTNALYLLSADTTTWRWTKREMCAALRERARQLRAVADECDRIGEGYLAT